MDLSKLLSDATILRLLLPIVSTIFLFIVLKPGIITIFTASKSERLLMNKELRQILYFVKYIVLAYLFPFSMFQSFKAALVASPFFQSDMFLLILASIGLTLLWFNSKKEDKWKASNNIWIRLLLVFGSGYYCICLGLGYSAILDAAIISKTVEAILAVCLITVLYWLFLKPAIRFFTTMDSEEIKVKIRLSNGQVIRDAYLLYPTHSNQILLGDKNDPALCYHKISLPVSKIEYIEFFITKYHWGTPYTVKNPSITIHKSK
ncbi:hypothetical protein BP422_13340 [Brevibacillus formosus]|uniref:Uncharacterized protein n=1 Tax=Brevibacillus formosus TaxID=54913 RepID=A0A220MHN8_9BACL|nr:hypothetical protein [Brevibacillus formosus]ASJ54453.1 hypothetical protein BP422_13340 [Brevibacillus formosus]